MSQSRALLLAVSAYVIWVLSDVCLKFGAQSGLPILVSMLLFGGVGVVYYPAAVFLKHRRLDLKPHCTREVLGISACSIGINFFNIIALARLPLTVFY
ncbi:MAG: hypothetical protein PHE27_05230, partial [Alphaproteobacteria bacterium]|nr:hypothetical protein [Alphaproteobacteria bacterium]